MQNFFLEALQIEFQLPRLSSPTQGDQSSCTWPDPSSLLPGISSLADERSEVAEEAKAGTFPHLTSPPATYPLSMAARAPKNPPKKPKGLWEGLPNGHRKIKSQRAVVEVL